MTIIHILTHKDEIRKSLLFKCPKNSDKDFVARFKIALDKKRLG